MKILNLNLEKLKDIMLLLLMDSMIFAVQNHMHLIILLHSLNHLELLNLFKHLHLVQLMVSLIHQLLVMLFHSLNVLLLVLNAAQVIIKMQQQFYHLFHMLFLQHTMDQNSQHNMKLVVQYIGVLNMLLQDVQKVYLLHVPMVFNQLVLLMVHIQLLLRVVLLKILSIVVVQNQVLLKTSSRPLLN